MSPTQAQHSVCSSVSALLPCLPTKASLQVYLPVLLLTSKQPFAEAGRFSKAQRRVPGLIHSSCDARLGFPTGFRKMGQSKWSKEKIPLGHIRKHAAEPKRDRRWIYQQDSPYGLSGAEDQVSHLRNQLHLHSDSRCVAPAALPLPGKTRAQQEKGTSSSEQSYLAHALHTREK